MARSKRNKSKGKGFASNAQTGREAAKDFRHGDSMAFLKLAMKHELESNLERIKSGNFYCG